MKKNAPLFVSLLCCICLLSCDRGVFRGFDKMDNGAYMKFYVRENRNAQPEIGDVAVIDVIQSIGDSIIFDSAIDYKQPMEVQITEPSFVGDLMCGLMNMHVNDSASLVFLVDSMFIKTLGQELPDYIQSGTPMYIDIKLKSIIAKAEIIEEEQRWLGELKANEEALLSPYYSNKNNKITEDGLIVLNLKKGKGEKASAGDILKIRFSLISLEGDTLLDLSDGEPYEVAFGDKALGEGFDEGLGMVGKGGKASFVIPSSLAFDSVGLENVILPYTAFLFDLEVVEILSREDYEAEQNALREKEEAVNQQRLKEEPAKISKYVLDHKISVQPSLSGIYYIEQEAGNGVTVDDGDTVSIHYNLYNLDEVLVESSYESGGPLVFVYGKGEMVPGIEEALGMMSVGGKARIIIPSTMGFGAVAIDQNLPANSTLIFDLEFLDLKN